MRTASITQSAEALVGPIRTDDRTGNTGTRTWNKADVVHVGLCIFISTQQTLKSIVVRKARAPTHTKHTKELSDHCHQTSARLGRLHHV